jgi:hypothetical protein
VNRDFFIGLPSSVKSCQKSPVIAVYRTGKLTFEGRSRINFSGNCQFDCFDVLTVTNAHRRFFDSVDRNDKIFVLMGDMFNGHGRLSGGAED